MQCSYCSLLIVSKNKSPSNHQKHGLKYGDGRLICTDCHKFAVKNDMQLQTAWKHVQNTLNIMKMSLDWQSIPIQLVDLPTLQQQASLETNLQLAGLAMFEMKGSKPIDSKISILYGMPAALAVEVLAHELAHVWCRRNKITKLPIKDEEGFCNVVAHSALIKLGKQYDAPVRVKAMFDNPDPVYGNKFREQYQIMQNIGWENYKNNLIITYS